MSPGVGVIASGHRTAGGGSVTVDIVENITVATTTSGSASATVTTSLVSNDRIVVVVNKATTSGTPSVSGLSLTWATDVSNTATADLYIFSASGATGGGSLSFLGLGTATEADVQVYVLRSSLGSAISFVNGNATNAGSGSAGVTTATSAATAPAGSLVLAAGFVSGGTMTFPTGDSNPSAGWTTDRTSLVSGAARRRNIHIGVTSDTSVQVGVTSDAISGRTVARAAYKD